MTTVTTRNYNFAILQPVEDEETPVRRIVTRRVFRHSKPLSEQEKVSLREIQKQKAKERVRERRTLFTKPEKGVVRKVGLYHNTFNSYTFNIC